MSILYLVDGNADEIEKQNRIQNIQYYQELREEIKKNQELKEPNINSVFINMSIQNIGIIYFMKDNKLENQMVQIYLHRLTHIEKFLNPILLTKEIRNKISTIISRMKMDGYTLYDDLIKWISESNIVNYVIYN
jgi:hypothetical protein